MNPLQDKEKPEGGLRCVWLGTPCCPPHRTCHLLAREPAPHPTTPAAHHPTCSRAAPRGKLPAHGPQGGGASTPPRPSECGLRMPWSSTRGVERRPAGAGREPRSGAGPWAACTHRSACGNLGPHARRPRPHPTAPHRTPAAARAELLVTNPRVSVATGDASPGQRGRGRAGCSAQARPCGLSAVGAADWGPGGARRPRPRETPGRGRRPRPRARTRGARGAQRAELGHGTAGEARGRAVAGGDRGSESGVGGRGPRSGVGGRGQGRGSAVGVGSSCPDPE